MVLQASDARRARVAWKEPVRRQSRRDQARRRAPGLGIPVFASAKKPQTALRLRLRSFGRIAAVTTQRNDSRVLRPEVTRSPTLLARISNSRTSGANPHESSAVMGTMKAVGVKESINSSASAKNNVRRAIAAIRLRRPHRSQHPLQRRYAYGRKRPATASQRSKCRPRSQISTRSGFL